MADILKEKKDTRRSKTNYYLDIAQTVTERGTCLRRKFGAIIVKDDVIISTGYAGAPRGRQNCCDLGYCLRDKMNIPRGERYELCRSVHAEANAIIAACVRKRQDRAAGAGNDLLPDVQAAGYKRRDRARYRAREQRGIQRLLPAGLGGKRRQFRADRVLIRCLKG